MDMCYERGCPSYGQYVHRYHHDMAHGPRRSQGQPRRRTPNEDDFIDGELRTDR